MAIDRIAQVIVQFENEDGSKVLTRTFIMDPISTTIKATYPQGRVPGNLELNGLIISQADEKGKNK